MEKNKDFIPDKNKKYEIISIDKEKFIVYIIEKNENKQK